MKEMEKLITGVLIILFLGWLGLSNCCSEKNECGAECIKDCCVEIQNEENDDSDVPLISDTSSTIVVTEKENIEE